MSRTKNAARVGGIVTALALCGAPTAMANHPVIVEGNCNNANDPAFSPVPAAGTCGDYDGDANIGTTEDNDGDRVFGTIQGANTTGSAATRINNNGRITIVTSGLFAETPTLSGNVILEGAPGVTANVDAVRQGDPNSVPRQTGAGIRVDAPSTRQVVLRNLVVRNWRTGVRVFGNSRLAIEDVTFDGNVEFGIAAEGNARVAIDGATVYGTGRRLNAEGQDFPTTSTPDSGIGISIEDSSQATVTDSVVSGSFGRGIAGRGGGQVCVARVNVFNNDGGNLGGVNGPGTNCVGLTAN